MPSLMYVSSLLSLLGFVCTLPIISAAPTVPPARNSSGCGRETSWVFSDTGHYNVTLSSGRTFWVHIPEHYLQTTPFPAVLSFHGRGEDAKNQELISQLSDHGLQINGQEIIAVYPEAAFAPASHAGDPPNRAWQGAPYSPVGVDDLTYTVEVVDELLDNLCVDTTRVYASGKSNGGGFTNYLACNLSTSKLFAAYAVVSGALYPLTTPLVGCVPGRPVPIFNSHGYNDTVIPFDGRVEPVYNASYDLPEITQYRSMWAARNVLGLEPTSVASPYPDTTLYTWESGPIQVQALSINNLGHSWPTIEGLDIAGDPYATASFNATNAFILPFFSLYTLPSVLPPTPQLSD